MRTDIKNKSPVSKLKKIPIWVEKTTEVVEVAADKHAAVMVKAEGEEDPVALVQVAEAHRQRHQR